MMLKTVDEACDFVAEWCQEQGSYPVNLYVLILPCRIASYASVRGLVIGGRGE
jgi:hypothetical protein